MNLSADFPGFTALLLAASGASAYLAGCYAVLWFRARHERLDVFKHVHQITASCPPKPYKLSEGEVHECSPLQLVDAQHRPVPLKYFSDYYIGPHQRALIEAQRQQGALLDFERYELMQQGRVPYDGYSKRNPT